VRLSLSSTSTRTFVAVPALVLAEQALARRPLQLRWLPLALWGYAQYKLSGNYRLARAGGPPGQSQGFPEKILDSGPYAVTRNPMYLGHLIFLGALVAITRSPVATAVLTALVPWFDDRAAHDEQRLTARFGDEYTAYRDRVPRWMPRVPAG
jgi:steroid 5-alpha reductase family enzyme